MLQTTDTRVSRFTDDPDNGPDLRFGTPRDLALMRLLNPEHRYQYLPWTWAYELTGGKGDRDGFRKRLGRMSRKPYKFLHRPRDQYTYVANMMTMVYTRGPGAETWLVKNGHQLQPAKRRGGWFKHEYQQDLVQASIELGAIKHGLTFSDWPAILNRPKTPEGIKSSERPFQFHVGDKILKPDGAPYMLTRNGVSMAFFKEIDRYTEDVPKNDLKSTIEGKLELYNIVFKKRMYHDYYGFPKGAAMVTFYTVNKANMLHMMEVAKRVVGDAPWLGFAVVPDYPTLLYSPEPTTEVFDTSLMRNGHPPFSLKTLASI